MSEMPGQEGLSDANIATAVANGDRFVYYLYCFSIGFMTFRRWTGVYLIPRGRSAALKGLPWTLLTLFCGWWGLPWGPVYSVQCLTKNLSGGEDVTARIVSASPEIRRQIIRGRVAVDEVAVGGQVKGRARFLSPQEKWFGLDIALVGLTGLIVIIFLGVGVYSSLKGPSAPVAAAAIISRPDPMPPPRASASVGQVIPKPELTPDEKAIRKWNEDSSRQASNVQQCKQLQANPLVYRADRQGHFWLTAVVNGAPVRFFLDTGATSVALTLKDAAAAGISRDQLVFSSPVKTANGEVRAAPVKLREMRVEQLAIADIPALVGEDLSISLLGMSFLRRFHFEMSGDVLRLTCNRTPSL